MPLPPPQGRRPGFRPPVTRPVRLHAGPPQCDAGRHITADLPGWRRPCPSPDADFILLSEETEPGGAFDVDEETLGGTWLLLCRPHVDELVERSGWEDVLDATPVEDRYLPGDGPKADPKE